MLTQIKMNGKLQEEERKYFERELRTAKIFSHNLATIVVVNNCAGAWVARHGLISWSFNLLLAALAPIRAALPASTAQRASLVTVGVIFVGRLRGNVIIFWCRSRSWRRRKCHSWQRVRPFLFLWLCFNHRGWLWAANLFLHFWLGSVNVRIRYLLFSHQNNSNLRTGVGGHETGRIFLGLGWYWTPSFCLSLLATVLMYFLSGEWEMGLGL